MTTLEIALLVILFFLGILTASIFTMLVSSQFLVKHLLLEVADLRTAFRLGIKPADMNNTLSQLRKLLASVDGEFPTDSKKNPKA